MPLSSWDRALECTRSALDRKAYDLVVLETSALTSIGDYFVICSGRSDTQVQAIAEGVRDHLASLGVQPLAIEGLERGQWVLIDFGDVVVHVFQVPIADLLRPRPPVGARAARRRSPSRSRARRAARRRARRTSSV